MAYIYVIDDDQTIGEMLVEYFESKGHETCTFQSAEEAHSKLVSEQPDILFLDVRLPGVDGLTFLGQVSAKLEQTAIIMMTGHADYHTAVQSIKSGAKDFISKPFGLSEIQKIIDRALEDNKKNEQLQYLKAVNQQRVNDMVGSSQAMQKGFKFIDQVAASPRTSVLIEGETGTGKGMVARAIHYRSQRSAAPFIEVNCAAFQTALLESELFGHETGAFTGAKTRKKGLLEIAHGGTFFLDEVGDMSLELQSKLLKVLEEQSFRRVGGTREIRIDTRIISATSKDIPMAVKSGQFRTDLYYRLHVASINLPPLREREKDILILAEHYLEIFSREFKKPIQRLSDEVKTVLMQHPWIGNVRELRNVIERAVLFETGSILGLDSIGIVNPSRNSGSSSTYDFEDLKDLSIPPAGILLENIERTLIEKAMEQSGGNKTQAAKLLGLSRETMKYRLKKYRAGHV